MGVLHENVFIQPYIRCSPDKYIPYLLQNDGQYHQNIYMPQYSTYRSIPVPVLSVSVFLNLSYKTLKCPCPCLGHVHVLDHRYSLQAKTLNFYRILSKTTQKNNCATRIGCFPYSQNIVSWSRCMPCCLFQKIIRTGAQMAPYHGGCHFSQCIMGQVRS